MYDEDASQSASMALQQKIADFFFCRLFGQTVEIHIILDREKAAFQLFHQFPAESGDTALDVFIGKGDVHLRMPGDQVR